jgi:hypothetical protein
VSDLAEQRISELEDGSVARIQGKTKEKKKTGSTDKYICHDRHSTNGMKIKKIIRNI